jgi:transposase-like protein
MGVVNELKVYAGLKPAYSAAGEQSAREVLEAFGGAWNSKYPVMYRSGDERWTDRCEFFKYSPEIRRAIYPANAIEFLNYHLRKVTKNRPAFSTGDAVFKIR